METTETRRVMSPATRTTPGWMTHPASAEVTTEWLIAAARAAPSWCGGSSPTRDNSRRRAGVPAEAPPA